jgi:ribA/ribD-fused uncharacterized protein
MDIGNETVVRINGVDDIVAQAAIVKFRKTYGFLSNMAACQVEYDSAIYNSVEHAYQAASTLDKTARAKIQRSQNPVWGKRMGKGVTKRNDWADIKAGVMLELLRQKFSQEKFRTKLLATNDQFIVEGNDHNDGVWGMCLNADSVFEGRNLLGKLLMQVRGELK